MSFIRDHKTHYLTSDNVYSFALTLKQMWESPGSLLYKQLEEESMTVHAIEAKFSVIGLCSMKQASCQCGKPQSSFLSLRETDP